MHSKILASLGLIGTVISASAFAEPPIQPGDTLESLSQAKVTLLLMVNRVLFKNS
jgi:hypothetical protein